MESTSEPAATVLHEKEEEEEEDVVEEQVEKDEVIVQGDDSQEEEEEGQTTKEDDSEDPPESTGCSARWSRAVNAIHTPILNGLQTVTQTVAYHPKRTVAAVTSLSLLLLVVGLMTNFTVDVDEDKLWTPSNSLPIQHSDWIDDESNFPADTLDLILFFHSDGDNVLGQEQVSQVFQALDIVLDLPNYDAVCAESTYIDPETNEPTCEIEGLVHFWNLDSSLFAEQVSSDEETIAALSERTFPDGTKVSQNALFGNAQRSNDDDDLLTFCQGYTVRIRLPDTEDAESLEDKALDVLLDLRKEWNRNNADLSLKLEVTAAGSFGDEFERAILEDIPLIPIVFLIMSVFTAIVFFKRDKIQSRSLLGFGAVVAVLLSLLSGFGLLFVIGTPFTSMTQLLPFVIFGIGLDDAFIIYGAYARTSANTKTEDRIGETIDEVGISITLTSITSSLAFGLGCLSSIPAVYWLCLYAFPTVILIYIYQLTFFIAWIVLDERRIQHRKRDCCICITVADEEDDGDEEDGSNDDQEEDNAQTPAPKTTPGSAFDAFMVRYAEFLLQPAVRVVVVVAFVALAVLCAISASKLTQEFEFTEVMPDDSYVTDFFHATDDYTTRNSINPFVYFRFVDQSDEDIQAQMEDYVNDLVAMDAVEEQPEFFWLRDFNQFLQDNQANVSDLTFNQQVDEFLSDPVTFDLYGADIVRNEAGNITASRVQLHFDNVDEENVREQMDTLDEQRDITKRQPINRGLNDWAFFNYDQNYNIWEFFSRTKEELIFTTIMGVVAVTGIALVFVPHWTAAFFVLPLISVLYVDLLGVMQWAGVHVNAVAYITVVLAIGLLVDFIMHVLLRYYECSGNRREKTIQMLQTMGSSILVGGISTFLGTLPLAFSTSTIFFTIFIAFVGLVTLGIGHGLILLPVLLATIGPEEQVPRPSSRFANRQEEEESYNEDKEELRLTERTIPAQTSMGSGLKDEP